MAMTDTHGNPVESQVVRLRNDGDTEYSQKYGGVRYRIPPGADIIVPFMAMCLWLGHPDAVDIDKKHRYRTQEFQRLCVKYGVYERHDKIEDQFPKISAWSIIDPTQEYITVVKDPDGKHLTPDVQTKQERDRLQEQMTLMQQQIQMLQAQIAQNNKEQASEILGGDTRTDNPTHRPEISIPVLEDDDDSNLPPVDDTGGATVDRPGPRPVQRQTT